MLEFKTRYTSVIIDELSTVTRIGKYPIDYKAVTRLDGRIATAKENYVSFIFEKYGILIACKNSKRVCRLIEETFLNPIKYKHNKTIIKAESINIYKV